MEREGERERERLAFEMKSKFRNIPRQKSVSRSDRGKHSKQPRCGAWRQALKPTCLLFRPVYLSIYMFVYLSTTVKLSSSQRLKDLFVSLNSDVSQELSVSSFFLCGLGIKLKGHLYHHH